MDSDRERQVRVAFRKRRLSKSWKSDGKSTVGWFAETLFTAVVTLMVWRSFGADDPFTNIILPAISAAIAFVVWERLMRPLGRYVLTVPEQEHVDAWRTADEWKEKHAAESRFSEHWCNEARKADALWVEEQFKTVKIRQERDAAIQDRDAAIREGDERSTLLESQPRVQLRHEPDSIPNYLRVARVNSNTSERRHIIGVVNVSEVLIENMRVVAEGFEPYLQGVTWVDAPLHPLRAPIDREGRFDLSVGDGQPTRFIEIFQELVFDDGSEPIITFVYDQSGLNDLKRFIQGDWFAVTLRIEGSIRPQRIRLVARLSSARDRFEVFASNETPPVPSNCRIMSLQSPSAAPRVEPPARPSHG